jgi:hypothetical protein
MAKSDGDAFRFKVITDPVHGEIALSEPETRLVDTAPFQRLRRLKQLGLASFVYPGATHTRFAHSLGVFNIMSRAIDLIIRARKALESDRQLLRIAALLHDIGHYPYSHLVESIDKDPARERLLEKGADIKSARPYPDHEKLGELIITKRSDIRRILEEAEIDPAEVAAIVRGQHERNLFNQLIHSSLDADRMDYLVRDSIATGVPFGCIDIQYLLKNLNVDKDGLLALDRRAVTAAEHFVVARYFMSKAVYLHKTVFGFEAMLRQALFLLRKRGGLWEDGSAIEQLVVHPSELLDFDDGFVDALIKTEADKRGRMSPLVKICRALCYRRPPELLAEFASLARAGHDDEQFVRFQTRKLDQLKQAAKSTGIPIECWLWEDPKELSFEKLGPFLSLTEAQTSEKVETNELMRIMDKRRTSKPIIEDQNSILHHLAQVKFQMARLYVVEEEEGRLEKARREVKSWSVR